MKRLSFVLALLTITALPNKAVYSQAPEFTWAKRASGTSFDGGAGIATDGSGNSYVTGDFAGLVTFGAITLTSAGSDDIFVAKYDASGNVLWAKRAGGTSSDGGTGIATDGSGNSYVTGDFAGSATFGAITLTSADSNDIFVAKYDALGNVLWAKRAGVTSEDFGHRIATDGSGNSYLTGSFTGSATFGAITLTSTGSDDIFVAKYDASGNVLWAKRAGGTSFDGGDGIAADRSGSSYVTGNFTGSATFGAITLTSAGSEDIFVAKYDASGNVLWAKRAGGTSSDGGAGIATDRSGSSYVTGIFTGSATLGAITLTSAGSNDIFIAKYDASGNVLWAKRAGGTSFAFGFDIATDESGNSYITGSFASSAAFDTITLTSAGREDIFVAKYDASGNVLWAKQAGGTSRDSGFGIATDESGNSYITGFFDGLATFGAITLTSAGSADIFVAKLVLPYPSTLTANTTVNFQSRTNASDYPATDYCSVGLPGASNRSVKDFLSGEQNKDWQVYWDNGAASNFFIAFDGSSTFQFSAGRAFWIINKGPVNINTTVPSATLNAAQEIEIPLRSGWNLITNPFTTSVAWSKIQSANSITEKIYDYKGGSGFIESSNFEPYIGYYYFETRTNPPTLKIPYALYFSSTSAANVDPAIWRVSISFSSGAFSDKSTSFGIAPAASRDLDQFDFRKPRAIATTPTVEFKRPQWDANYSAFATDIRPEIEEFEIWAFEVHANQRKAAQLAFSGIGKIPNQFEVYLVDENRARTVNLREDSLYRFTPAAELLKFSVLVGKKETVQEKLSAIVLPKEFALGPNYPNPFLSAAKSRSAGNPSTTIPVAIPISSEIKLKIYNLLGAEVKTIYNGAIEAGRYWFNWDGRNELGHNVATGVYLYRLTANTRIGLVGKIILIR